MKNTFLTILAIVVIVSLIWWFATRRREKGGLIGWKFFRQMDSEGNDIKHIPGLVGNVKGLRDACKQHPDCVAFNTSGYLKSSVDPNKLKEYSGYPDWAGLYVKKSLLK